MLKPERQAQKKGHNLIAGIDEAGRGPLAGPVVASAVIIKDTSFTCEINDSKKLTPKKRLRAFHEIVQKAIVGISIIGEEAIDRVNIRQASILAMENAVNSLALKPDMLLIDGLLKLNIPYKQTPIIRGDSKSLSIAAASIVAKVVRDCIMVDYHSLYPQYNFHIHKGYGTRNHIKALRKHGPSPIHRTTFKIKAKS